MKKAVITGDIIHSTRMDEDSRMGLTRSIVRLFKELEKDFKVRSEMFRGDSFQCLVPKVEEALRVALLIKTYIRSRDKEQLHNVKAKGNARKTKGTTNWVFDARLAIGIGEVPKSVKQLATTSSEAFFLSGHLLDDMKDQKQSLDIDTEDDQYREELQTEMLLLDTIISKTTALQCEVIFYKLRDLPELDIANILGIGQSAVNQRSNAGSWHAIRSMLERFETIYENE